MVSAVPIVDICGVTKSFGRTRVLDGIDLKIPPSSTVVLLGASGSGKTTLLRCLNRLDPPTEGVVWLDGCTLGGSFSGSGGRWIAASEREIAEQRQKIGFVFQRFNLFPHLTVLDNVAIGPRRVRGMSRKAAHELAAHMLERVHLEKHLGKRPAALSGGQQQRCAIARSLAMEPKVILFDEPTSALDPELVQEVLDVMRNLAAAGMTMVVVTHELRFARDVGTDIVFLRDGVIWEQAPPERFFSAPAREETRQFLRHLT